MFAQLLNRLSHGDRIVKKDYFPLFKGNSGDSVRNEYTPGRVADLVAVLLPLQRFLRRPPQNACCVTSAISSKFFPMQRPCEQEAGVVNEELQNYAVVFNFSATQTLTSACRVMPRRCACLSSPSTTQAGKSIFTRLLSWLTRRAVEQSSSLVKSSPASNFSSILELS